MDRKNIVRKFRDQQTTFRKKNGVRNFIPVIFKCYDTERIGDLESEFHHTCKKKLERSSIDVDLDVSFLFIGVFLKSRRTCVFYTVISFM